MLSLLHVGYSVLKLFAQEGEITETATTHDFLITRVTWQLWLKVFGYKSKSLVLALRTFTSYYQTIR